jgi:hypothetical protein
MVVDDAMTKKTDETTTAKRNRNENEACLQRDWMEKDFFTGLPFFAVLLVDSEDVPVTKRGRALSLLMHNIMTMMNEKETTTY